MASGHVNRIKRPNTWLHRPMLQNVKKALANSEPSTHGTKRTCRSGRCMSVIGGKADVPELGHDFRFCPRLCENVLEPRMRRIVFSISFSRQNWKVQLVFTSTKSRRNFYTQVERQSFHTAWTQSGHDEGVYSRSIIEIFLPSRNSGSK